MDIKKSLLGVFEISLYMREGVERFGDDIKAFKQSFIVVALSIPVLLMSIPYLYSDDAVLQKFPVNTISALFVLKFILVIVTLLALSYWICRMLNREDNFLRYVTTANWVTFTPLIIFLPFLFLMKIETFTYIELAPYLQVVLVYTYSLGACVAKWVLKIPWTLAVAISILSVAVNDVYFKLFYTFLELYN